MNRRLIIRAEAEADITEAAMWYEGQEGGLGFEFTGEIRAATRRAVERPLSYLRVRKRPEVRRILARRFKYRIFYIVRTDAIVVFSVLHAARHDRHWKERA